MSKQEEGNVEKKQQDRLDALAGNMADAFCTVPVAEGLTEIERAGAAARTETRRNGKSAQDEAGGEPKEPTGVL